MERKPQNKINFRYNISVYFDFLKKHKFLIGLILLVALVIQLKTILDKFLFKLIVDNGAEFVSGNILASELSKILLIIGVVFSLASLISAISQWFEIHLVNIIEANMLVDLKRKFFNHLLTLDHNFHISHKTGSLISRLIRGGGALERLTDTIVFEVLAIIFQLVAVTASLIYFDKISAIIVLATVVVFVWYNLFIQRINEPAHLASNNKEDIERGSISDIFTNVDSIKYFGKEELVKNKYRKLTEETKYALLRNWDYYRWRSSGQTFIIAFGTLLLLIFPLTKFLNGNMTLGTLTFIYTIYMSLIGHMFGFVSGIRNFYRSMADFQDLFEYGLVKNEIKDKPNASGLKIEFGSVEFRKVSFNYGKEKAFSLNDFSLKIKPNEKIALVGHSGCGKSTLVKLLYRFFDVKKGEILIDGKNITDFKQESLREELSIVPQECVLFDDTIFNNIKFANPKATRQEVLNAIKFAQLDKTIKNFPYKENTIVGERGVKLSGGEKQRVSIARAILANKKILVLDEATSSLDSETEHEIQRNLKKLLEGRTSIIIAHRLSTIMNADRIIVMKNGKIIQQGKHSELIKQSGEYKKLWNLQKGGYIQE